MAGENWIHYFVDIHNKIYKNAPSLL